MTMGNRNNWAWAILFVRLVLGLIFFMAGLWKIFTLGPLVHCLLGPMPRASSRVGRYGSRRSVQWVELVAAGFFSSESEHLRPSS